MWFAVTAATGPTMGWAAVGVVTGTGIVLTTSIGATGVRGKPTPTDAPVGLGTGGVGGFIVTA